MEAVDRQEYPAMLDRLQPQVAVTKLNDRVKRISKVNAEIADWLQERRKVEDLYATGLRKLAKRQLQESSNELGVFDTPWRKIVGSIEAIADSHYNLSERINKEIEQPLRQWSTTNREMQSMSTIQGNLGAMAKELVDAQNTSEKLVRKGGKANAQKVENARSKLQSAEQQWQSQAPFVFETLQALDEKRLNDLRDLLTQYQTYEAEVIERGRITVEQTLNIMLEIDTTQEIKNWSAAVTAGKPITERTARQLSSAGGSTIGGSGTHQLAPPTPRSTHTTDAASVASAGDSKLVGVSRKFGTMMQRRRQSIHGGFARAPSPSKGFTSLGRNSNSSSGRPIPSPRSSSNNLRESPGADNRLSALPESPPNRDTLQPNGNFNGIGHDMHDVVRPATSNGERSSGMMDLSEVEPPPGPPPSHFRESQKDAEGFSVPAAMNDPISQAQQEAAQELNEPQFKLDIRDQPIPEQDADAEAALSSVANTLRSSQLAAPNRKLGTVRGRRDVRNTVYVPSPSLEVANIENNIPPSPSFPPGGARAAALAAIADHGPPAGASSLSDTTSIRSGHSLSTNVVIKHAEMHHPGLNASIIEHVTASLENGEVKTAKVAGEIALAYIPSMDSTSTSGMETIRINNFPNLEAIAPNPAFVHPVSDDKPDEFTVDLGSISHKTTPAFSYRAHVDDADMSAHSPLLLKQSWRPQGNDKVGLIFEYCLNPAFSSDSVRFHNLILVACYTGPKAAQCQIKPLGLHDRKKSIVEWKIGDVTLTNSWQKVICRFFGSDGSVPQAGHLEARWEIQTPVVGSGITLSKLESTKGVEDSDPFADESLAPTAGNWVDVETARKIAAGKPLAPYEAR